MSRPRITFLAAMASSLALLSPTLMAQPAPGGGTAGLAGLGGNLLSLATHPAVQAELQLTEGQEARLKALGEQDERRRQRWLERAGLGSPGGARRREDASDAEPPPTFAMMIESRQEMQEATERSIARILSKAQYARVRQIQLQVEGPGALLRPEMQERLGLGEDQLAQLRELMQERRRARRETREARGAWLRAAQERAPEATGGAGAPRNGPADRSAGEKARRAVGQDPQNPKRMAEFRAQDESIEYRFRTTLHARVLTRRQSQTYRKMLGAPFDPSRFMGRSKGGPGGSGPVGNRGGVAEAPSLQPGDHATADTGRTSLRERRGLGKTEDRP